MLVKALKYSFISLLLLNMSSCIENDIPYPYIEGVIQEIQVEGMQGEAVFNNQARTIELTIGEDAFIDSLPITKLVANTESLIYPDTTVCIKPSGFPDFSFSSLEELPANANTAIDFTNPVSFLLKTYQDYWWKITVKQEIERTIEVENQSGTAPSLDLYNHIAIIYVNEDADYRNIKINKLNLEGSKTVLEPAAETVTDFTRPQVFKAYRNGRYICDWTVDIQKSSVPASVEKVNAWATKAYINGSFRAGTDLSVEYRIQGEDAWTTLDAASITATGATSYSATLTGLKSGTNYEVRALADGNEGETLSFQTETIVTIPNMNFDTWTQSGKTWYPNPVANNLDEAQAYWATGNEGVTIYKESSTVPVTGSEAYRGTSAKLYTYGDILLVGAAAGNLFIGTYKTNMGTPESSPSFGRPYSGARPTKLSGYYKYKSMPITYSGTVPGNLTNDECQIYLRLWNEAGQEIAFGEFTGSKTVTEYTKFEFDINYTDTVSKPAKITIVATSSKYGGEFDDAGKKVIGQVGDGSTLWVDEFELSYD
ncbi:PCMD domain-containing protein [Phocaeicola plebeius]|mgnify:FL=1|jgi:hypothetical protein|uniref:PCMD domain-containing protein n=1 Tax=Phocaeicola plebeius TaxID=310297 RepID=UPI0026EE4C79|nr:PCMD domain-containing protein [Phocaeicola plebeius]